MEQTVYSFKKLHERHGITTYYTKPSSINKYNTPEEVLKDYNDILDHLDGKKWSWIIDGDGFEILDSLDMKSGMGISKLLTGSHGEHLQSIRIINPTWSIRAIIKMVMPFLQENTRKKIHILTDRVYSILEFL